MAKPAARPETGLCPLSIHCGHGQHAHLLLQPIRRTIGDAAGRRMSSIFLSYDREDFTRAKWVALALEKAGHSVWWDRHIKGGAQYSKEIENALKEAEAVVVLWSERSVESAWVRDEAAAGRDSGRLVPVALDNTEPPLGFRQYQTIGLTRWKGRGRAPGLAALLGAVEGLAGASPSPRTIKERPSHTLRRSLMRPWFIGLSIIALVITGVILWKPWGKASAVTVVSVASADTSETSTALARDLLVQLQSLQTADADALQIIEQKSRSETDLLFKVGGSASGQQARANVLLLRGTQGSLLWARDFEQTDGDQADLKQQVAYAAALVLKCATEALSVDATRLDDQTLKLYLNGCATFADIADPGKLIPVFREVTTKAPRFEGGWAKLLYVEAATLDNASDVDRRSLAKDISAAREVNPNLPEAYLAERALLPAREFTRRMALSEEAVARNPDHPVALAALASQLRRVGRMHDAVQHASRAAELDPLSPVTRDAYISSLAYAGRTEAALQELKKAERLWPGASNMRHARFRIQLRNGDPREALRMLRSEGGNWGAVELHELFLKARIEPTAENIDRAIATSMRFPTGASLAQLLGEFNRADQFYESAKAVPPDLTMLDDVLFRPGLKSIRRDARFIPMMARYGLLEHWRQSGKWPDFCFEPDLPYDCKVEAAKHRT